MQDATCGPTNEGKGRRDSQGLASQGAPSVDFVRAGSLTPSKDRGEVGPKTKDASLFTSLKSLAVEISTICKNSNGVQSL